MRKASWIFILGLLSVPYVACTTSEEDICDIECDCEGCSNRDYDNCVRSYDNDFFDAERNGCLDLYDELLDCRHQTWTCRGSDFDTRCGTERDRLNNCIR